MKASRESTRALSAPLRVSLAITAGCNLRCAHCSAGVGRVSWPPPIGGRDLEDVLRQLRQAGVFEVRVTGGEPLCHANCLSLLEYAASLGMGTALDTNATLVDRKVARQLARIARIRPIRRISVSLDGATRETHERLRGAGSYDAVVAGIQALVSETLPVRLFCTVTRLNAREIADMPRVARELGAKRLNFNILAPTSDRSDAPLQPSRSDREYAASALCEMAGEHTGFLEGSFLEWALFLAGKKANTRTGAGAQVGRLQSCTARACSIRPDGTVVPCDLLWDLPAGNVLEKSFIDIWRYSSVLQYMRSLGSVSLETVDGCKGCPHRFLCSGGCRAAALHATGRLTERDPSWCVVQTEPV